MKLDFNKVISCQNVDKAEIGKVYYFMDAILASDVKDVSDNEKDILEAVCTDGRDEPFKFKNHALKYGFIYPAFGQEEKHYLTYEELKERWLKNPTELYRYKDNFQNITGMITFFDDNDKTFQLGYQTFRENLEYFCPSIKNLTDINGNPLISNNKEQ